MKIILQSSRKSSVVVGSRTAEQICAIALDTLPNNMLNNLLPSTRCYTVEEKKPTLASLLKFYHKRTASLFQWFSKHGIGENVSREMELANIFTLELAVFT